MQINERAHHESQKATTATSYNCTYGVKSLACRSRYASSGPSAVVLDQVCRTSTCLAARRLTPQPFHPRPLEDPSIGPRRTASLPSQPSRAHLVASLSLAAPLVLICALPAEIWRRRPSRRRPEAPRAPWARAAGGLRHPLAAARADPRLPRAYLAQSPPRTLKPCFPGRSG